MKVQIDVSDEVGYELDVSDRALVPRAVTLDFDVADVNGLRATLELLGGADTFRLDPVSRLQVRYNVPVTADGEPIATATFHVWLGPDLLAVPRPESQPVRALMNELEAERMASRG